jgi:hypothetical protein
MKILQWLRNLRQPKRAASEPSEAPVRVQRMVRTPPDDDEMMAAAIMRCWNSGNMVIANRDDKGNVTMTEHEVRRPNAESSDRLGGGSMR